MPLLGLGTWKSTHGEAEAAVVTAVRAGYRHIDCASIYGNEGEVGRGLARVLQERVVARQELWITTKLWNTDHPPECVRAACLRSLRALGVEYLDLYLMHWPVSGNVGPSVQPPLSATWAAMEALVGEGLVRHIGVSNFSAAKLRALMEGARLKPAVLQVEAHPYFRNEALLAFCRDQGIHMTAFSPLGSPDSASLLRCGASPQLLKDPVVVEAARKLGRDVGQVLIRWALERGTSVLPKSSSPERIKSNLDVLGWSLPPEDSQALNRLKPQCRMVDGSAWIHPQGPYRSLEELWDDDQESIRRQAVLDWAAAQGLEQRQDQHQQGEARPDSGAEAAALSRGGDSSSSAVGAMSTGRSAASARLAPSAACLEQQPTAELYTGARMPLVGLGTWKSEKGQVAAAVSAALAAGYRHIDCAEVYRNEGEVGQALGAAFALGLVTREQVWVTGKLWNSDHAPAAVGRAVRRSLKALRLDSLDLYLMHWPATGISGPSVQPPLSATWAAMEALVGEGLVRHIGVSNFSAAKLRALMEGARLKPAVLQVEAHPYFRNEALLAFCRDQGIHTTAYSPLGSPDSADIMRRTQDTPVLLQDPTVNTIAQKLGRSPAQVLVRWALERGTSVLPKSSNPERIKSNLAVFSWALPPHDFAALGALSVQQRMVGGAFLLDARGPYRTLRDLWDEGESGGRHEEEERP